MDYEVTLDGFAVGRVSLARQGLYYHLRCRCDVAQKQMYRLEAARGGEHVDLGILVPMDRGFGMESRFPVKRLGEGKITFHLRLASEPARTGRFVPISPEEPFAYLSRLRNAVLVFQDGKKGILLPESDVTG